MFLTVASLFLGSLSRCLLPQESCSGSRQLWPVSCVTCVLDCCKFISRFLVTLLLSNVIHFFLIYTQHHSKCVNLLQYSLRCRNILHKGTEAQYAGQVSLLKNSLKYCIVYPPSLCIVYQPSLCIVYPPSLCIVYQPSLCIVYQPSLCIVYPPSLCIVYPPSLCIVYPPSLCIVYPPSLYLLSQ